MTARLLVVDDDPAIRQVIELSLQDDYEIETAADGQEAIDALQDRASSFSGMILDLSMPRKSGFDVLERLSELPGHEYLPVVVLTAMTDRTSQLDAFVGGGHAYVSKPFEPDELLATVRRVLSRSRSARQMERLERVVNLTTGSKAPDSAAEGA